MLEQVVHIMTIGLLMVNKMQNIGYCCIIKGKGLPRTGHEGPEGD